MSDHVQPPAVALRRAPGRASAGIFLRLTLALTVLTTAAACRRPPEPARIGAVRITIPLQSSAALALLAAELGYLKAEGIDTLPDHCASGKVALDALLRGDAEAITAAEVPIVFQSFSNTPFKIVATLATVNGTHAIVARRDHGIDAPEDLRGKRIATQRGSAVHFFMHVFLLRHGLAGGDVTTQYLPVDDLPRALQAGTVDAASLREPYVSQTVEALGEAACVFEDDAVYVRSEVLVVSTALLDRLPAAPGAILRALLRAEAFAQAEPARAVAMVARVLNLPPDRIAAEWPKMSLHVALDQSLLRSLEEEARWARDSGLVSAAAVPDYVGIIDASHLLRTKPEAVSIIR